MYFKQLGVSDLRSTSRLQENIVYKEIVFLFCLINIKKTKYLKC